MTRAAATCVRGAAVAHHRDAGQPSAPSVTVLIVEDHELLAQTLALGLCGRGFTCTVATVAGPASIIEQAGRVRPSLVLLDLQLDGIDGIDLIPALRALGARVLVVSGCQDHPRLAAAIALGAAGWVSKTEPFERLLEAAEAVGRRWHPHDPQDDLLELGNGWLQAHRELQADFAQLTARERQVLWRLSEGASAQEIAQVLSVSVGTVRTHIKATLSKLGVSSQLAAVARTRSLLAFADGNRDTDRTSRRR